MNKYKLKTIKNSLKKKTLVYFLRKKHDLKKTFFFTSLSTTTIESHSRFVVTVHIKQISKFYSLDFNHRLRRGVINMSQRLELDANMHFALENMDKCTSEIYDTVSYLHCKRKAKT